MCIGDPVTAKRVANESLVLYKILGCLLDFLQVQLEKSFRGIQTQTLGLIGDRLTTTAQFCVNYSRWNYPKA